MVRPGLCFFLTSFSTGFFVYQQMNKWLPLTNAFFTQIKSTQRVWTLVWTGKVCLTLLQALHMTSASGITSLTVNQGSHICEWMNGLTTMKIYFWKNLLSIKLWRISSPSACSSSSSDPLHSWETHSAKLSYNKCLALTFPTILVVLWGSPVLEPSW